MRVGPERRLKAKKFNASYFFQESCMDVRVGLKRRFSAKELMLLNWGAGEDS